MRWLSGRASDSGARGQGSKPTTTVICPSARHFTPRKYWQNPRSGGSVSPEKLLTGTNKQTIIRRCVLFYF